LNLFKGQWLDQVLFWLNQKKTDPEEN